MDMHDPTSLRLQVFFITRLRRFAALACAPEPTSPERRQLASRATVSAFRDCAALGLQPEARRVLSEALGTVGWRGGWV
jgi:hypothetical protein